MSMQVEEKYQHMRQYCLTMQCQNCPVHKYNPEHTCGCGKSYNVDDLVPFDELHHNFNLVFGDNKNCMKPEKKPNPYWENITKIAEAQREKGISEYGHGVEDFKDPCAIERIQYAEEELVDALMYLEWLKDCLGGNK